MSALGGGSSTSVEADFEDNFDEDEDGEDAVHDDDGHEVEAEGVDFVEEGRSESDAEHTHGDIVGVFEFEGFDHLRQEAEH